MPEVGRDIEEEIGLLEGLSRDDLRQRWRIQFGRAVSPHLPKPLLLRLFAYRLQTEVFGDLKTGTIHLLDRLSIENSPSDSQISLPRDQNRHGRLKVGTVLVREHGGANHHVTVTEDGYCWNGKTYSSLSQVATTITGTKWNGLRFFGLQSAKASI